MRVPKDKYPFRNMTAHAVAAIGAAIMVAAPFRAEAAPRWSVEKAKAWGEANPWWCGVNYIPANAINYTAMWDKTGFSPDVIRRELRLMTELGMNCVRFVMQYKVYEDDPEYFTATLEKFLSLCDEAGVKAMPIFFDDCAFGVNTDPVVGRQPEPLEGWYAWAWSPSPGHTMVIDEREHPKLEKYVKDVISRFKDDKRIFLWDLYNEPSNSKLGFRSCPLLKKTFAWAREVNPSQPISSGIWNNDKTLNAILLANSDVVTFHCYANREKTAKRIKEIVKMAGGRPVVCTEWMNRTVGSTVKDCLGLFKEANVGCLAWGLVNGKTQTHLRWGHRPENLPYKGPWQHDFSRGDFTPYDAEELATIRAAVAGAAFAPSRPSNPLFEGWYADPQIRKYGNEYWVFPTASDRFRNQTFLDAFSSRDLKTWVKHERILTTNEVKWARGAMWAPDAHEVGGKYYLFFSANDAYPVGGKRKDGEPQKEPGLEKYGGIGVAVADRPEGPYRDLIGKPLVDRFWNRAQPIDQYVFEYKGEWYMLYGGWGRCNLIKLAKDFKSLVPFEDGAMWRDMTPKNYVEGSVMFERKGKWYFMYSSGSWTRDDYCVNYSVGDTPFGPFEFKGRVLGIQRPLATGAGHHSVVCVPGTDEWYICYHRRPIPSKGPHHRVVCIDRMEFGPGGEILPVVMTE